MSTSSWITWEAAAELTGLVCRLGSRVPNWGQVLCDLGRTVGVL